MLSDAQLWLVRHGQSDGKSPDNTYRQDYARTLTPRGAKQSIRAGKLLTTIAPPFAAIYTSPMVRCLQSAQLICAAFGPDVQPTRKPDLIEKPERYPNVAIGLAQDGAAVLLVGHGPEWDAVIQHATGRDVRMSRGSVAAIRIRNGQGALEQLLTPTDVKRMV